jgi:hypothetical protein
MQMSRYPERFSDSGLHLDYRRSPPQKELADVKDRPIGLSFLTVFLRVLEGEH